MSLSIKQVLYIRGMAIKHKDYTTIKRLRKRQIDKQEFRFLVDHYKLIDKGDRILNILRT